MLDSVKGVMISDTVGKSGRLLELDVALCALACLDLLVGAQTLYDAVGRVGTVGAAGTGGAAGPFDTVDVVAEPTVNSDTLPDFRRPASPANSDQSSLQPRDSCGMGGRYWGTGTSLLGGWYVGSGILGPVGLVSGRSWSGLT
jgi:hypothetical protein